MKTDLEILNERANRLTLFFIPAEFFPNLTDEQKKLLEKELFFGRLYLYREHNVVVDIEKNINKIDILRKTDLLENNILRLIEINEKGNKDSFSFLLEKYVSRIKGWEYIHDWLYNNVDNNIVDLKVSIKSLLQFQLDITRNHLSEIESRFGKNENIRSEHPESILLKNKDLLVTNGKTVNDIINEKNVTSKRKKRQSLITDEEADSFLLETIFNVQFESKN